MSAEQEGRTEQATSKKRREERLKGNVCQSPEISAALIMLMGFILIGFMSTRMIDSAKIFMFKTFTSLPLAEITNEYISGLTKNLVFEFLKSVAPFLGVAAFIGIIANIAQVKWVISFKHLENMAASFNVINGLKKMFSMNSLIGLVKDLLKTGAVGFAVYKLIETNFKQIFLFTGQEADFVLSNFIQFVYQIGTRAAIVLIVFAIIDYLHKKKQYEDGIKMTKQQVKDEHKSEEGDPHIKGKRRSKQLYMSRQRMLSFVADADVVITNPTTYAVALKYSPKFEAPIVTAKGMRLLAEKIKDIAIENDIPIVENVFVAQTLYWNVEINQEIPAQLFQAVAEILAYVYKLKNKVA
jgi:flagellar biosynthesis protein FlhB